MIKYEIEGGNLPVVICYPEAGQTLCTENGLIAFASSFPGSIIAYEVTPGNGIIVQKKGFLAIEKGLDLSLYFQKKLGKGFFGEEGFIMQRISGRGMVFLEIDGHCKVYDLKSARALC